VTSEVTLRDLAVLARTCSGGSLWPYQDLAAQVIGRNFCPIEITQNSDRGSKHGWRLYPPSDSDPGAAARLRDADQWTSRSSIEAVR
jgi:hypothetical protein